MTRYDRSKEERAADAEIAGQLQDWRDLILETLQDAEARQRAAAAEAQILSDLENRFPNFSGSCVGILEPWEPVPVSYRNKRERVEELLRIHPEEHLKPLFDCQFHTRQYGLTVRVYLGTSKIAEVKESFDPGEPNFYYIFGTEVNQPEYQAFVAAAESYAQRHAHLIHTPKIPREWVSTAAAQNEAILNSALDGYRERFENATGSLHGVLDRWNEASGRTNIELTRSNVSSWSRRINSSQDAVLDCSVTKIEVPLGHGPIRQDVYLGINQVASARYDGGDEFLFGRIILFKEGTAVNIAVSQAIYERFTETLKVLADQARSRLIKQKVLLEGPDSIALQPTDWMLMNHLVFDDKNLAESFEFLPGEVYTVFDLPSWQMAVLKERSRDLENLSHPNFLQGETLRMTVSIPPNSVVFRPSKRWLWRD